MVSVLLALLQQVNGTTVNAPEAPPAPVPVIARAYSGRAGQLSASIPRLRDSVTIDGTLSETAWQQASILSEFTSYSPVDGRPAQDNTEVRLWYADDALYVAKRTGRNRCIVADPLVA